MLLKKSVVVLSVVTFCVVLIVVITLATADNTACQLESANTSGQCVLLKDCPQAIKVIRQGLQPQICNVKGAEVFVCCENIQKRVPGEISKQKCAEYAASAGSALKEFDACTSLDNLEVIAAAFPTEFPHMALIGFGEEKEWRCSGTLISDQFVMVAGHCLNIRNVGAPKWVRLGELDINPDKNFTQPEDISIMETFIHPDYKWKTNYNDIGLIKLNKTVQFNQFIRPACLHTNAFVDTRVYIVTCYGYIGFRSGRYNTLHRIIYEKVSVDQCSKTFLRSFSNGINPTIQLCAGTSALYKCQGESGSPLQVYNPKVNCMSRVIGITTHGTLSESGSIIGVYTKVSGYTEWIEQIVWPEK